MSTFFFWMYFWSPVLCHQTQFWGLMIKFILLVFQIGLLFISKIIQIQKIYLIILLFDTLIEDLIIELFFIAYGLIFWHLLLNWLLKVFYNNDKYCINIDLIYKTKNKNINLSISLKFVINDNILLFFMIFSVDIHQTKRLDLGC